MSEETIREAERKAEAGVARDLKRQWYLKALEFAQAAWWRFQEASFEEKANSTAPPWLVDMFDKSINARENEGRALARELREMAVTRLENIATWVCEEKCEDGFHCRECLDAQAAVIDAVMKT